MVKRRTFKRSVKAAVNKVMSMYQRRKINYVFDLYWDNQNNLYIDGQQSNSFIVGQALLGNQNEFLSLGKQYGFVKLRGILIEVNPDFVTSGFDYGICLGNTNDVASFQNLKTQPNVLLIDTKQKSKMYVKVSSQFTSTNSIELFNNVALLPFRQNLGNDSVRMSVKVTLYLTFKTTT